MIFLPILTQNHNGMTDINKVLFGLLQNKMKGEYVETYSR